MLNVSRREVLRSLVKVTGFAAASSFLPILQGCHCRQDYSLTLNVVLHGLFVLNFTDTNIELLTPEVHDHIHRAGNWDRKEVYCLQKGDEYALCGVTAMPFPPVIFSDCNVEFSQQNYNFTVRSERSVYKMWLPFPQDIRLLRCTPDPALYDSYPSCIPDDPYGKVEYIKKLSLCQVLIYRVKDYRNLTIPGIAWKPKIDYKLRTANLHLWAEPEDRLTPCHADYAYQKLDDLLGSLHLRLKFNSTVPLDRDTGVQGLPPEQEQGWSDWASGGGEGAYPTNCCSVITRK